jgi:hypothetical protein
MVFATWEGAFQAKAAKLGMNRELKEFFQVEDRSNISHIREHINHMLISSISL